MKLKAALAVLITLSAPSMLFAGEARGGGDTIVLTPLTSPGYPEGVVVEGTTAYVSGPATFGTAGKAPSRIVAVDTITGRVNASIDLAGEDLSQDHALSCLTTDGAGRLYALSTQLGVVRIDTRTGAQSIYATIPHLPVCSQLPPGPCKIGDVSCLPPGPCVTGRCLPPGPCVTDGNGQCLPPGPCAPVATDRGSLANDLAFDDAGNLYITDSFQATIFVVPPGGGAAQAYYQDARFDTSTLPGFSLGFNGIRLTPNRSKIVFTASFGPNAGVWTLPAVSAPSPTGLANVTFYSNGEMPDGLAFGASGRMFVALAGTNQIGVFDAWGREYLRGSNAAYDNPANIAFNGRGSLLITNHALFGDPADAALLDTWTNEIGSPLAKPIVP